MLLCRHLVLVADDNGSSQKSSKRIKLPGLLDFQLLFFQCITHSGKITFLLKIQFKFSFWFIFSIKIHMFVFNLAVCLYLQLKISCLFTFFKIELFVYFSAIKIFVYIFSYLFTILAVYLLFL